MNARVWQSEDYAETTWEEDGQVFQACAGLEWITIDANQMKVDGEHSSDTGGAGFLDLNNDGLDYTDECSMPNLVHLTYCTTAAYASTGECVYARAWTNPIGAQPPRTGWVGNGYCG